MKKFKITNPSVCKAIGICKNCNSKVVLRKPWLSRMPIVNDGCYVIHCSNDDCHNSVGFEIIANQDNIIEIEEHMVDLLYYANIYPEILLYDSDEQCKSTVTQTEKITNDSSKLCEIIDLLKIRQMKK